MKIVLDTNVLMAALISPLGASFRVLEGIVAGDLRVAATPALWAEYEEQLAGQRFTSTTPLTRREVEDILDFLASVIEPAENDFLWRGILPDDDDAMVVEAAFNGDADFLLTFNASDFESIRSQVAFGIVTPAQFLGIWENRR